MKILLFGKNGQLGWELQRALAPLGELIALDRQGEKGLYGDLADLEGLQQSIRAVRPDVLVNAAAYTAVDRAESEADLAACINAQAPGVMARCMAETGGWLLHYSTDYVFDGGGSTPWSESDDPCPLNQYGQSKLDGERAIQAACDHYIILRTSWVYAARGRNFAKTMLRLAREREELTVIDDQIGAPTSAELLADVSAHVIRAVTNHPALAGIYHVSASGQTSWYAYARAIIQAAWQRGADLQVKKITPIATRSYQTPARRPLNSRLNTQKIQETFQLHLPDWQQGVERLIEEIEGV